MTKQIGPIDPYKALKSRWPTNQTLYSARKRITMHRQCCYLLSDKLLFLDLHLFIKNGLQMARSVGDKYKRTFYLEKVVNGERIWRQYV